MPLMRKRIAFTLIELLIVVAIIGILAAIAVPNFMNAQMRAKVAKVTAELRNLGVAMETYYLDEGNYPPFVHPNYHFIVLTSPIAYFTGLPDDIFDTGKSNNVTGYHSINLLTPQTIESVKSRKLDIGRALVFTDQQIVGVHFQGAVV